MICPELWLTTNAGAHFTYIAKVFPFILKCVSVIVQGKRELSKWNLRTTKMHHCENFATDNLKSTIRRQRYTKWRRKKMKNKSKVQHLSWTFFFQRYKPGHAGENMVYKVKSMHKSQILQNLWIWSMQMYRQFKYIGQLHFLCHTSSSFAFRYPVQDWWISV